jgi:hypothetical protein
MEVVSIVTALIIAAFIVVAYRLISAKQSSTVSKNAKQTSPHKKRTRPTRRSPYRATSIACEGDTCSAVKSLLNVRFLDLDNVLHTIPVSGCNVEICNCKFARHADRRDYQEDRRSPYSLKTELYDRTGKESLRVAGGGRRRSDLT